MIYIILIFLGLALGSFVNALVWRLYNQDFATKKNNKGKVSKKDLSITKGRSMCVNCYHTLAWYDLIPVLSWLGLNGKCRYCNKPINWQYPLVEIVSAVVLICSYSLWPFNLDFVGSLLLVLWLLSLTLLTALTVFDIKWQLLPDRLVFPLIGLASLFASIRIIYQVGEPPSLPGTLLSVLIAGGLFYGIFIASNGKMIGGGDGKLGVALGLLLGAPALALLMIFLASLLGTLAALPTYLKNRINRRVPFGPFLITSTVICFFYGSNLIDWYLGIIGL